MQKITIKNFGPVENITDLEIPRVLFLIGPQASGKSTIAKLVYFFRTVPEMLWECLNDHEKNTPSSQLKEFLFKINYKFNKIFGKNKNIEIIFQYTPENVLQISNIDKKFVFSNKPVILLLFKKIAGLWNDFQKITIEQRTTSKSIEKQVLKEKLQNLEQEINQLLKIFFGVNQVPIRIDYIPAGRSLLTSIKQSHTHTLPYQFKEGDEEKKSPFDFFTYLFFKRIEEIRQDWTSGTFLTDLGDDYELDTSLNTSVLEKFKKTIPKILKADYFFDGAVEYLKSKHFEIPLNKASSGQQEVLWILIQLFVLILEKTPSLLTIEEPEAHLYPTAQVDLLQLIMLFVHANPNNEVIITTHSPYLLTAANNLLFAYRVLQKHPEQKEAIEQQVLSESWINPKHFGAYYVTNEALTDIFNPETGVISESALDDASENIMNVFDELMDIYKS
jgi:predicted ATP-dependent endonuclease of OLD family